MATRRMFSKNITSSDSFLSMSATAQNLYFHLGMEADDDGFAPFTKISKMLGTSHDDAAQLIGRGFLIQFPYGVYVIRDWKINNEIRSDRYQPTIYQEELSQLRLNASKQYYIDNTNSKPLVLPNDNHLATQDRIGKDRIDKIENSTNYLTDIPQEDIVSFTKTYNCTERQVKSKADDLLNYCSAHGKRYKNYKAFLKNALKKDFGLKVKTDFDKYKDMEVNKSNIERMSKIKAEKHLV